MKASFMSVIFLLIITACSNDNYCEVKNDLLGKWESIDNEREQLTFNEDNTVIGTFYYKDNQYSYGFVTLDTIAFIRDVSGHTNEFAFEMNKRGNKLIIKKFRTADFGTEKYDRTFVRID